MRLYEAGDPGLLGRRLGRPTSKRVPPNDETEIKRPYRTPYQGSNARHIHEQGRIIHRHRPQAASPTVGDLQQGDQRFPRGAGCRDSRRVPIRRQHRNGNWHIFPRNRPVRADREFIQATHRRTRVSNYLSR